MWIFLCYIVLKLLFLLTEYEMVKQRSLHQRETRVPIPKPKKFSMENNRVFGSHSVKCTKVIWKKRLLVSSVPK